MTRDKPPVSCKHDKTDLIELSLAIGPNAADQQLIEARNLQIEQIARCFSGSPQSNVNKCRSCGIMFRDGETCPRGGCPMGGDF